MIHINNLKEKELLIAHYFCGNGKKEFSKQEVFDMWSNWFKKDFRVNGNPVFCIVDNELVYRKGAKVKKERLRIEYNQVFQSIYKRIKHTLENKSHDKSYFKQELQKERNKEYGRVIKRAKQLNIYLAMSKSFSRLAEFKLIDNGKRGHIITSGDCDKMIEYLKNMKREKSECNSNN